MKSVYLTNGLASTTKLFAKESADLLLNMNFWKITEYTF